MHKVFVWEKGIYIEINVEGNCFVCNSSLVTLKIEMIQNYSAENCY